MKKLMIAAAIVCAAALSQAAQVQWNVSGVKEVGGAPLSSGNYSAYGFLVSDSSGLNPTYDLADIVAMVNALQDPYYAGIENFASVGVDGAVSFAGDVDVTGVSEGKPYDMHLYALITDNWNFSEDYKEDYGIVGNYQLVDCGTVTFKKDAILSGYGTAGEWSSVPEPTSGLLLLLGVAGLALRRRRA